MSVCGDGTADEDLTFKRTDKSSGAAGGTDKDTDRKMGLGRTDEQLKGADGMGCLL